MNKQKLIEATKAYVVHCKRDKYDVYVGRPSKFGNLIKLSKEEDREIVLKQYIQWLQTQPQEYFQMIKKELRGKILGCWCSPKLCHGMILAALANDLL